MYRNQYSFLDMYAPQVLAVTSRGLTIIHLEACACTHKMQTATRQGPEPSKMQFQPPPRPYNSIRLFPGTLPLIILL